MKGPINNNLKKMYMLSKLKTGHIYISYTPSKYKNVYGYYLYDNQTKLYVWTRFGTVVYNGLIKNAKDELFDLGIVFIKIRSLFDNLSVINDNYFYLIHTKLLQMICCN